MKMGIGLLGEPGLILKRKFRYTLTIDTPCNGTVPAGYVKVAARPQLDIDEVELNFLNGVDWVPGKGRWQPISVTYVDAATSEMQPLYSWLATVYDFTDPVFLRQSERKGYSGTAVLKMFDGCGKWLEEWTLLNAWPQSINFGDLDYSSSEECTIDLTLRYSKVSYRANKTCGAVPEPQCAGCGTSCTPNKDDPAGELDL